jgi:hypothetical protein
MTIEISGAPFLADEPEFGALVVRVPLNEEPSPAWLQHFRTQQLPGHAHKTVEGGLVFYLDRNDQDVARAMRGILAAIDIANERVRGTALDDEKAEIKWKSAMDGKKEKIDKKLAEWWASEGERSESLPSG